ncbi:hypothetical protein [Streptomyces sp. NPDC003952]
MTGTDEPADSFEAFARATGLADLFELDEFTAYPADDFIQSTDADGDSIALMYAERTADDGEAVGLVSIRTYGVTGVVLLDADAMDNLAEWLRERAERSRALAAGQ